MIIDLNTEEIPTQIDADICIVGAGAAGLTIAQKFAGSSKQIALIEAGGLEYSNESQDAYRGKSVSRKYDALEDVRLRFFGGSTNHWSGWCRPLDEFDFETKDWVPHSGWPISQKDLKIYASEAARILDLSPVDTWGEAVNLDRSGIAGLDERKFAVANWAISPPTRMGEKYLAVLRDSNNIRVYLNATVANIALSENFSHVDALEIRLHGSRRARVVAGNFVLAMGGLENPRLLLNSDTQIKSGVGNQSDLVGRYFMEHPHGTVATIKGLNLDKLTWFFNYKDSGNFRYRPGLILEKEYQIAQASLNCSMSINPGSSFVHSSDAYQAFLRFLGRVPRSEDRDVGDEIASMLANLDEVAIGLYQSISERHTYSGANLHIRSEQSPNPDSRVFLGRDRDQFGSRRLVLDWRLSSLDKSSIALMTKMVGMEIGRLGLGRVKIKDWVLQVPETSNDDLDIGSHHIGTTRMSSSAQTGVVDGECKVFGLSNLYIAGSSVFSTGGVVPPTFTIVQLALRLADHLKSVG